MFEFSNDDRQLELKLTTATSFPLWSYGAYLSALDLAYRKILIVDRIGQLLAANYSDNDLAVAEGSIDAFPSDDVEYADFSKYTDFSLKEDSPYKFWDVIVKRKRPAVFYKSDVGFVPILTLKEADLHLLSGKVTSPGDFTLLGGVTALAQLFFSISEHSRREEAAARERELHDIQVAQELVKLKNEMLKYEVAMQRLGVPPAVRRYQRTALAEIRRGHDKKAALLGIKVTKIDMRA